MLKPKTHQIKALREALPYGSLSRIRRRLKRKGKSFSVQYISRCLNPDKSDFNQAILDEAILLSREIKTQKQDIKRRILQFSTKIL